MAWRGKSCEAEGVGKDLPGGKGSEGSNKSVQPCQQGYEDDKESQLLGWERRLGLVEKSIENLWIRIEKELFLNHCMSWRNC